MPDPDRLRRRLAELAERFAVPGAALGIAHGAETVEVACGVTNVDTGVEVTTDSLFQIGSMTKVWTASVVMRLVDDGRLDLDEPVVGYLPELTLADPAVTRRVTMRHLLTHTSGIDGDVFDDRGRGDDCLVRYVEALDGVPQNHPLNATWSYCNAGYVIAGRVIEKLTGLVWDAAMRELLFTPLGLMHTVTLPEQALLHRVAVGHIHEGTEPPRRTPVWMLPRGIGPAGLITSTVADVLAYGRMHLRGGLAADGTRVLSGKSVAAMQRPQVALPDPYTLAESWGIGWFLQDWHATPALGHDGNTIGQAAFLRVLPGHDLAVTLLTNGGHTRDLYEALIAEIVPELVGVRPWRPLAPPEHPVVADVTPHLGVYERTGARLEVLAADGAAVLRVISTRRLEGLPNQPKEMALVPVRPGLYVGRRPGARTWSPVVFYALPDGTRFVHFGARATPKVA